MKSKPYKIVSKEEGRGEAHRESFATLAEARDYIRDRWQGPDYIDGPNIFHTDYSTFRLLGFTLADVGERRCHHCHQWCDGGWFEWDWLDVDPDRAPKNID